MWRNVTAVLLLVLVHSSVGCGDTDDTGASDSDRVSADREATLDCAHPIQTDVEVPESYEVIGGALALPTATSSPVALQTAPGDGSLGLGAKAGLLLKAGASFTLTATGSWEERAGAWWGNTGQFVEAPSFSGGPCEGTGWLVYPGGFSVTEPGCVPFEVRVEEAVRTIQVGIGAPCPGQQPPPEPSAE